MNVPYSVVEVNPLSKKELKVLHSHTHSHTHSQQSQVPIAVINEKIISDSSSIIQYLQDSTATLTHSHSDSDSEIISSDISDQWCEWSSERLAVVLYPNITRTLADSWAAFAYVSDVQSWSLLERLTNRTLGPVAMYLVRNKIKRKYGIVVCMCMCV